ncbi:hypothetical protein GALMADRAFT_1353138 [Galerina marginata CBS 339.88]|uniref:Uncharacterized protein n=1 Tax=Galerina marginata (strain CBS 339.88) TaxID=685588 RepID=A0A067SGI2_GALM3|nr:hypothetical protein GALMADRAFT_1353138 [Galerina marginata CBS 339.88]
MSCLQKWGYWDGNTIFQRRHRKGLQRGLGYEWGGMGRGNEHGAGTKQQQHGQRVEWAAGVLALLSWSLAPAFTSTSRSVVDIFASRRISLSLRLLASPLDGERRGSAMTTGNSRDRCPSVGLTVYGLVGQRRLTGGETERGAPGAGRMRVEGIREFPVPPLDVRVARSYPPSLLSSAQASNYSLGGSNSASSLSVMLWVSRAFERWGRPRGKGDGRRKTGCNGAGRLYFPPLPLELWKETMGTTEAETTAETTGNSRDRCSCVNRRFVAFGASCQSRVGGGQVEVDDDDGGFEDGRDELKSARNKDSEPVFIPDERVLEMSSVLSIALVCEVLRAAASAISSPGWDARRIDKLVYQTDLGMNSTFNPKNKGRRLHRRPAFFGTIEECLEDCCENCPKPIDIDEKTLRKKKTRTTSVIVSREPPGRQSMTSSFNPIDVGKWSYPAALRSNRATVQKLPGEGIDLNQRDHVGRTSLHVAIFSKAGDIACNLIDGDDDSDNESCNSDNSDITLEQKEIKFVDIATRPSAVQTDVHLKKMLDDCTNPPPSDIRLCPAHAHTRTHCNNPDHSDAAGADWASAG